MSVAQYLEQSVVFNRLRAAGTRRGLRKRTVPTKEMAAVTDRRYSGKGEKVV